MSQPAVTREEFGRLPDGSIAEAITLRNGAGLSVRNPVLHFLNAAKQNYEFLRVEPLDVKHAFTFLK